MTILRVALLGLVLGSSIAAAQTKRRALDGTTAVRVSGGIGIPIGSERLANAWSSGAAVSVSAERYLTDRTTTREFSLGVLYKYSAHPFDEASFVREFRPNGDTAITAAAAGASVQTLAAIGRLSSPHGPWSQNLIVDLGLFSSTRPDVTYTSASGTKVFRMDSKLGFELGLGWGMDLELGASNAISLEASWSIGSSNKDEVDGSGAFNCNSGGCGIPHQRTQVISFRAGVRRILRRAPT